MKIIVFDLHKENKYMPPVQISNSNPFAKFLSIFLLFFLLNRLAQPVNGASIRVPRHFPSLNENSAPKNVTLPKIPKAVVASNHGNYFLSMYMKTNDSELKKFLS